MGNNILSESDKVMYNWKFKTSIHKEIDLNNLILFWLQNYFSFEKELEKCKIYNYNYGISMKNNKIILICDLYEKKDNK